MVAGGERSPDVDTARAARRAPYLPAAPVIAGVPHLPGATGDVLYPGGGPLRQPLLRAAFDRRVLRHVPRDPRDDRQFDALLDTLACPIRSRTPRPKPTQAASTSRTLPRLAET